MECFILFCNLIGDDCYQVNNCTNSHVFFDTYGSHFIFKFADPIELKTLVA